MRRNKDHTFLNVAVYMLEDKHAIRKKINSACTTPPTLVPHARKINHA